LGESATAHPFNTSFSPSHRLEEWNLVKACWVVTANKRRTRVYEVTEDGLRRLEREEQRWRTVTLAVGRLLEEI
jgi:PadR family transcriptional regulator